MKRIITLMLTLVFLLSVSTAQAAVTQSATGVGPLAASAWPTATSSQYMGSTTYGGSGWVTMDGGTDLTVGPTHDRDLGVGWHAGTTGTLTLDGNNASDPTTLSMNILRVAYKGVGVVNVTGNAVLSTYGTHTILGASTAGNGTVNITDGGTANFYTTYFHIGLAADSTAALTVGTTDPTDATATLISGSFDVGRTAQPTSFTILDTGYAKTYGDGKIGYKGYARNASCTISGGLWEVNGTAGGWRGKSTILVEDGGVIDSQRGVLALEYSNDTYPLSLAMITGDGSQWVCEDNMVVGSAGIGILNIANGGEMVADVLTIDEDVALAVEGAMNDSRIDILGGKLTIAGDVDDDIATFLSVIAGSDNINVLTTGYALVPVTSATAGVDYTLTYDAGAGTTTLQGMTVPEPGTIILLLGLVFAGLILRKK